MPLPPPPLTPALQAVNNANKVILIMQLLAQAGRLANEVVESNSITPMGNGWAALNTAPFNSDGTVSSTQDASPNSSNGININLYPTLLGAYTSTELNQFLALAISFQSFASGALVQNGLAPDLLISVNSQ